MNALRHRAVRNTAAFALAALVYLGTSAFVPVVSAGSLPGGNCKATEDATVERFVGGFRMLVVVLDNLLP
jgi:hypothetical protein